MAEEEGGGEGEKRLVDLRRSSLMASPQVKRASQMEFLLSASLSDHTALLTMLEIERPISIGLSQQFGGSLMLAHHSKTTCTHTPLGSECKRGRIVCHE